MKVSKLEMLRLSGLVVASHNKSKIAEIKDYLLPLDIKLLPASDIGAPSVQETEDTFEGNALLKARALAEFSKLPALADDSGLIAPALGGLPGVHGSAGWAELPDGSRDFSIAMKRLEMELGDNSDTYAFFTCVLALVWPNGEEEVFEGIVEGDLSFPPKGNDSFGYDPIFVPKGYTMTFAEMLPVQKRAISHRARALEKLVEALRRGA